MIVGVLCEKGGTGKTTIATNLSVFRALQGKDVVIVDTDPQGSANFWCGTRMEDSVLPSIYAVQKVGKGFSQQVLDIAKRYDDVIIDAGGRDSTELRESLTIADIVVIPLQASQYDIWTITRMDDLVRTARSFNPSLKAFVLLNRTSTNPQIRESDEALKIISEFENLELLEFTLKDRICYRRSASQGLGIAELENKDEKATHEFNKLYQHIYGA